jgi:hypothetical protein
MTLADLIILAEAFPIEESWRGHYLTLQGGLR